MRRLFKFIGIIILIFTVLIGGLIAIPILYKNEIVALITKEVNKQVDATIYFNPDISLSLIRSFPKLYIQIEDFSISGKGSFKGDTLFSASSIKTKVDLKELYYHNTLEMHSLSLQDPFVNLLVIDSQSNWEITKEDSSTSEEGTAFSANFEKVDLENARFAYTDSIGDMYMSIKGLSGSLVGKFNQDVFDVSSDFLANDLHIVYDGIPYLNHLKVSGNVVTSINLIKDVYQLKQNNFHVNNLDVNGQGSMAFVNRDDINFDLTFATSSGSFKSFMSLIPAYYLGDVDKLDVLGTASLSGYFKGLYSNLSFPGYGINIDIKNGSLAVPGQKQAIKDLSMDFKLNNPDGITDHLVLTLQNTQFLMDGEICTASLLLKTPESDPYIDLTTKGKINLATWASLLPQDQGLEATGKIAIDAKMNGNISDLEKQNVQAFAASGNILAMDLKYVDKSLPNPVLIPKAEANISNNSLQIKDLWIKAGKSEIMGHGLFTNWLNYALGSGTLGGSLNLSSSYLNEADFVHPTPTETETNAAPATNTSSSFQLPKDVDLNMTWNIAEMKYSTLELSKTNGTASLKNGIFSIPQMNTDLYGGSIDLRGVFDASDATNTMTDLNLTAQNFDIQNIFSRFETIRALAPIAQYAKGKFSSKLHLRCKLLSDFSPDLKSLTCSGILDIFNCDISGLKSINSIGQKLQQPEFTKPFSIKDLLLKFGIEDGKIKLEPFFLNIGESILQLEGTTGLDRILNFTGKLEVPKELYEQNAKSYNQYVPQNKWVDLKTLDYKNLVLGINILGSFDQPEVKLSFDNIKKGIKEDLKAQIKGEVDKRKAEAEGRLKKELDDAKNRADQIKKENEDKAKQVLEEQKRALEERLRKERDAAAQKAKDDLKNRTGGILKK